MKFLTPIIGLDVERSGNAVLKVQSDSNSASHLAKIQLSHLRPDGVNYSQSFLGMDTYSTYLSADEGLYLQTNGATRLFVHGSGNVGIGTTSPLQKLHVGGNIHMDGSILRFPAGVQSLTLSNVSGSWNSLNARGINIGDWYTAPSYGDIRIGDYNFDVIRTDSTNLLHVNNSGKVGIGTTSPNQKLHVAGGDINLDLGRNLRFSNQLAISKASNGELNFFAGTSSTNGGFNFHTWNGASYVEDALVIRNNRNVGIGTPSPTEKLEIYDGSIKLNDGTRNLIIGEEGGSSYQIKSSGYLIVDAASGIQINKTTSGNVSIANGNFGIGTTSPNAQIQIDTPANNQAGQGLRLNRPAAGDNYHSIEFATNGAVDWSVGQNSNDAFEVYENGLAASTRFTIKEGGRVGIGTTNPSAKLHILDNAADNHLAKIRVQGGPTSGYSEFGTQSGYARIFSNGTQTYAANSSNTYWYIGGGSQMALNSSGLTVNQNVMLGDSNTKLSKHNTSSNALRVTTPTGWTSIGSANTSWSHFDTDRAQFYFGKPAEIAGSFVPYQASSHRLGTSTKRWSEIHGDDIYQGGYRVMSSYNGSSTGDWNDLRNNGVWRLTGSTNNPFGSSHATGMYVMQGNEGNYGFQLFSRGSNVNDGLKYRYRGTDWESWQTLATQSWVQAQGYLTSVPSEYLTQTEGDARYLQSLPSHNHDGRYLRTGVTLGSFSEVDAIEDDRVVGLTNYSGAPFANHNIVATFINHASGGRRAQLFFGDTPDAGAWLRLRQGSGVQHDWYKLWNSFDFTSTNISNWNTAYGWGNHANAGYLTSLPSHNHDADYVNVGGDSMTGNLQLTGGSHVRTDWTDGSNAVLNGTGVIFNRTSSYLRPDASGAKNLYIGGYGIGDYDWGQVKINTPALYWNDQTIATRDWVNSQGHMTPIYNGADNNGGTADFAVGVGGTPQISWRNQQVQIGGTDMNWAGKIYHNGSFGIGAWDSDMLLFTQGGSTSTYKTITLAPQNASGGGYTTRLRVDGRGYTYFPGLELAISNANSTHGISNYLRGDATHLVIGTGGTLHLNYSGSTTVMHGANWYPAANGTVNLGTSSAYFNRTYTNSIQGGGYSQLNDYVSGSTWYIRPNGRFVFANHHDWTQSIELSVNHNGVDNDTYVEFGQRTSNNANGRYKGVNIVKYVGGSKVDGDLIVGRLDVTSNTYFGNDIMIDDNNGTSPSLMFRSGDDTIFQFYKEDNNNTLTITRQDNGGADFRFVADPADYSQSRLQIGTGYIDVNKINSWDAAYSWGNHANAGYLTGSHTHSAADITSGTLNGARLPWASGNDGFTGTYGIVWRAGDQPWTASWLTVNGQTDTLNTRNIDATGNITIDGVLKSYRSDTNTILQSYNKSATGSPAQFYIRHNYGNVDIANTRGNIYFETRADFETVVVAQTDLYVGNSIQHWGDGGTGVYFNTDQIDFKTQGVIRMISAGTDGRTYFGSNTNKGYLREFPSNTYGSQIGKIARITFTGGFSDWDGDNHAIVSKDINGSMADSLSINSYNDITVRLDSNNNNGTSHFYITNDTLGSAMNNRLLDMNTGTNETEIATAFIPYTDRLQTLGRDDRRWQIVFCETLDSAGQHESNLQDEEQPISQYETGTVLSWKDGKNRPCKHFADHMRMGIAVHGQDSPLIQGAEPVLCTGIVEEGDYLVTSEKEGHAVAVPRHIVKEQMLFDCVIGKALENGEGESHLIKTWINI